MIAAHALVSRSDSAVVAEVDGQLVALDVNQGVCYGLNRVATRIWNLIQTPTTADKIVDVLTQEFDVDRATCLAETLYLLTDLQAAGLARAAVATDAAA